jgi:AraC-like DNA-binding protein
MDREEIAKRYIEAYERKDIAGLLRLMHPQGSYYDAFWGETCSGRELAKYYRDVFEQDTYWYKSDDELVSTPTGFVIRYIAFDKSDIEGLVQIFNGAEVMTMSDNLILTISDFYCDPNPVELIEVSLLAEEQHSKSNIAPIGLSAKTSGRIKRRLDELASDPAIFTEPSLTVTQLADLVDCSVMHLFHVLEEEQGTSFVQFVNECRCRYATDLLTGAPGNEIDSRVIAKQSGFESVDEFNRAFFATFDMTADECLQRFSKQ